MENPVTGAEKVFYEDQKGEWKFRISQEMNSDCSMERTGMAGTTTAESRRRLGVSGYNGCRGCGDGWSSFICSYREGACSSIKHCISKV